MKNKKITDQPLSVKYIATHNGAYVSIEKTEANKYMGYPSTYAACMSNGQYLTDTTNMATVKAAGACAAAVERLHDEELKREEANLQKGYPSLGIPPMANTQPGGQPGTMVTTPAGTQPGGQPGTMVTTPAATASEEDCPCAKEAVAKETSTAASLENYQMKNSQVEFTEEEKKQIQENLKESDISKMWWVNPQVDGKPYFGTDASEKDYSRFLSTSLDSVAKTKKQWDKIDKKELDRDSKKEKVKHEKDAVKDDQSKINKLKKGKPSVKKSVEEHDLKKDQEFDKEDKIKYSKADKKGNLPPWLKDKKELDKDSKKEKVEHEKDAVKDDKKQIKDLKKDEKEDKKSEKKDKGGK